MQQKLTCLQAYKIMNRALTIFYFSTYDECIGDVMSWGALSSQDENKEPRSIDGAMWHDWMDSVKYVLQDDTATYNSVYLTYEQAYAAAHKYLALFCDRGAEQSVLLLRDWFAADKNQSIFTQLLYQRWKDSIENILANPTDGEARFGFVDTSTMDQRESFASMKFFLNNFCKYNFEPNIIKLLQGCLLKNRYDYWSPIPNIVEPKIWKLWLESIHQIYKIDADEDLNFLTVYQVMPIFLQNYFKNQRSKIIDELITSFATGSTHNPINITRWQSWTNIGGYVNREQIEMGYNVVSINRPIPQIVVFEMITAWLDQFKDLIGQDTITQILDNKSIWLQLFDRTKQQQTSYLFLDDEITVLESYHLMLDLLKCYGKDIPDFATDPDQDNKPKDFIMLLEWLMLAEDMVNKHATIISNKK